MLSRLSHRFFINGDNGLCDIDYLIYTEYDTGESIDAERIIMECDNLNTYDKSSFCEALPSAEALRLARLFEFLYTLKYGSWLDIAEIELSRIVKTMFREKKN